MRFGFGIGVAGPGRLAKPLPPIATSVNYDLVNRYGSAAGILTLTGQRLTGATLAYGGVACTSVVVSSPTSVTFATPNIGVGLHDLVVTTPGGSDTITNAMEAWYPDQMAGCKCVGETERGVTTVGGVGTDVTVVLDQSTNANDLASVAGERPTFGATGFGARHSFNHNGAQEFRIAAKHAQAAGLWHFMMVKTTSLAVAGDYNPGQSLVANYPSPAFNTFGLSSGFLDYIQFNGSIFVHDQKATLVADGTAKLVGVSHVLTGDVKQFINNVQDGSTVNRGYSASNGWRSWGNSDGAGLNGKSGFFVTGDGAEPSLSDRTKLQTFAQTSGFFL